MDFAAPQTREESVGRIGTPDLAVGHTGAAATRNGTFLFATTVVLTELVPTYQICIAHRTVPKQ